MKKVTLFAIAVLSASFLFAGTGIGEGNFLNSKNDFLSSKGIFSSSSNKMTKRNGRGGDAFAEGKMIITVGYGFPNVGKSVLKTYESYAGYKVSGFGPLSVKGEYALSDKIGFGLSVNYVSFAATWIEDGTDAAGNTIPYTYTFSRSSVSVLGRMNIHFATSEKLDPYWGVGAGYRTGSYKFTSNDPFYTGNITFPTIPFGFETTIGLRYYFSDNIGAYVEMGYAKALIQGGLALKF